MNPNEQLLIKDGEQVISKDPNGAWAVVRTVAGSPLMRVRSGTGVNEQSLSEDQAKSMAMAASAPTANVTAGQNAAGLNTMAKVGMAVGAVSSVVAAAEAAKNLIPNIFKKKL